MSEKRSVSAGSVPKKCAKCGKSTMEKMVSAASGMVVATTFASNVARVKTLAEAGERAGALS